jgi:HD superfamily phosphohydrolase
MQLLAHEIRDPLHGDIRLSETELRMVDHPLFQRLRRCSQLPFVRLVFPGATHTRFEHSIGVMHLADLIYSGLTDTKSEERKLLRAAALLHDIAEPPYYPIFKESDTLAIDASMREFAKEAVLQICESTADESLSADDIVATINGEKDFRLLHQIIDSEVGANRIDYLLRDSYFCGVTYGNIDKRILFQFLKENGELVLGKQAIPLVDTIFSALFQMKVNVYDHKIARAAYCLLQKALNDGLEKKSISLASLIRLDDEQLLARLEHSSNREVERLRFRQLPRLAYCVYSYALKSLNNRKFGLAEELEALRSEKEQVAREIGEKCGVSNLLLDFVQIRPTKGAPINVRVNDDRVPIDRVPLLWKWYHDEPYEQWRLHIFCDPEERRTVESVCDGIFGFFEVGRDPTPKIRIPSLKPIYDRLLDNQESTEPAEKIRAKIFSLPDNERETLTALSNLGRGTATEVSEITHRSRATESLILNRLLSKNLVETKRMGRRIMFVPVGKVMPAMKSIVEIVEKYA